MAILIATKRIRRAKPFITIPEYILVLTVLGAVVLLSCAVWGGDISPETLRSWVGASR